MFLPKLNNPYRKLVLSYKLSIPILIPAVILCHPINTFGQDYSRTIKKTAKFSNPSDTDNKFRIMNINGSVTIEAYDGNTIELTVDEQIEGSPTEIEQAKRELKYNMEQRDNRVLAYLDAPFVTVQWDDDEVHYHINRDNSDYQFIHHVHVKVPRDILLDASTINKGTLSISGSFKEVKARNVNGGLDLKHLTSKTCANTVNGNITASYDRAPGDPLEYHTVNGTIKVYMPGDLSADVYFKSLHGDLYTDFENVKRLQPEVNKKTDISRSATTYRLDKFSPIRIGSGGPKLRFEVLNGDVYIRKRS